MAYILVVDDDETVRSLLYEVLYGMGHTVCEAANGTEAINLCSYFGFDLVIMDYYMSGMNGLQVAMQFGRKSDSGKSPFILHTCDFDNYELRSNAINAGALGIIAKISNIKMFRQEIKPFLQHLGE